MELNMAHFVFTWTLCAVLQSYARGGNINNKSQVWGVESLGEEGSSLPVEVETYKQNLLQYVLRTNEPSTGSAGPPGTQTIPYIMDKLYNLLADKSTGKEKRSAPFEVDMIRGLEDHYETQRRMQFWFNMSSVNSTEDLIECYFHIYKKRAPVIQRLSSHTVSVSLYRIVDEAELFTPDGSPGAGVELLERQQVSAYTGQWIVFKTSLKEAAKEWLRTPSKNKGLLLTATDSEHNHVNGTHIDFIQRGEQPLTQQPVFVVYTDKEKRKNKKHRKKHRKNIDYMINNFLNEDSRKAQANRQLCVDLLGEDNSQTTEDCTELLLRRRRSIIDEEVDLEDDIQEVRSRSKRRTNRNVINTDMLPDFQESKTRLRRRHDKDMLINANRRRNDFCQQRPLYISFEALKWENWIIAPRGVNANFCEGKCPFPLTSSLTGSNHAVLQSVSNYYHPDKVKPPCCVPQKLKRMSILYHQTETVVTMMNYDDMLVESCGCR